MSADERFPRGARLLRRREFEGVLRAPEWRTANRYFRVSARQNQCGRPRLGLAVPKRVLRLAIQRHRVKRIIRESFRVRQGGLPDHDFVVGVRGAVAEADNATLFSALEELWAHARGRPCDGS
ncbi:ribonuclease P protein component [Halorhodospira halophila]|uniref:Ribonuclease P protein component n=1 Tax=Halorhodospira halophila (strain DSM 244 / SL1) TaxID=349124 RepID=RNPA_HALHL|nr:ribonuclease P protein component [Halorhodospira halophila]A1WWE2.1 RecName: Full=Ribonuclease P protein component; Short=RNase P protein; Short=RNaseP protein; AltName: Full=Protein C5 [Halorhodospira halophila SL1]ABM62004.1 ribonuclease P protein component [Halorhodospira halophila SL1]